MSVETLTTTRTFSHLQGDLDEATLLHGLTQADQEVFNGLQPEIREIALQRLLTQNSHYDPSAQLAREVLKDLASYVEAKAQYEQQQKQLGTLAIENAQAFIAEQVHIIDAPRPFQMYFFEQDETHSAARKLFLQGVVELVPLLTDNHHTVDLADETALKPGNPYDVAQISSSEKLVASYRHDMNKVVMDVSYNVQPIIKPTDIYLG